MIFNCSRCDITKPWTIKERERESQRKILILQIFVYTFRNACNNFLNLQGYVKKCISSLFHKFIFTIFFKADKHIIFSCEICFSLLSTSQVQYVSLFKNKLCLTSIVIYEYVNRKNKMLYIWQLLLYSSVLLFSTLIACYIDIQIL